MLDILPEFSFSFWVETGIALALVTFGYLVAWWFKLKNPKKSNIDWNVHSRIHDYLSELRVITNAARAQIFQFHNGDFFIDGVSMQKFSMTHESLANGVSEQAKILQNQLVSLFTPIMEKLEFNKPILYKVDIEKESYFKNNLLTSNVNSYMILPLYCGNLKSGFVMLQWCCDEKTAQTNKNLKTIENDFSEGKKIIQTLLTHQLKDKK